MGNYGQNNLNEQDRRRKINDLQREMVMSESDLKRIANEKILIESEERKIKKEIGQLKIALQEKQRRFRVVEQDIIMRQAGINNLRKKINSL